MKSTTRVFLLLPFLVAAPALVLLGTRLSKYAPSSLLLGCAAVGLVFGVVSWWQRGGPALHARLDPADSDRIASNARRAIEQANAKVKGRLTAAEISELWVFYERWINLEHEEQSRYREELASDGIPMLRLGDALRYLGA